MMVLVFGTLAALYIFLHPIALASLFFCRCYFLLLYCSIRRSDFLPLLSKWQQVIGKGDYFMYGI